MPGQESQLPIFSLENMIAHIKTRLQGDPTDKRPRYTLILGSGFSVPIIPSGGLMLSDIVWWLYLADNGRSQEYCDKLGTGDVPIEYRRELWAEVHRESRVSFGLRDGLPADSPPDNLALAYQALMSAGCPRALCDPTRRRQYLRDVVRRAGSRINPAHLYLASILRAQDEKTRNFAVPFCRTVFTTNFDPLLQRALQLADKLYFMSDCPYGLETPEDDQHDAIHLVYTHGSVHRYFLVNSESEFRKARDDNARAFRPYFRQHGVIVLGCGGWMDATMAALGQCETFDGNLYWCDRHPAQDAPSRLRQDVVDLLTSKATAFYVPIAGADEALQALHEGLGLGPVPDLLVHPIRQLTSRLRAITVTPRESAAEEKVRPMAGLEDLMKQTLQRLEDADWVFERPREPVAIVAKRMSEALILALLGEFDRAIAMWTTVAQDPNAPARQKAGALLNRGLAWRKKGEPDKAIADYTAVVEMADTQAEEKAQAFANRGVMWRQKGEPDKAIADYAAVVEMADAPAEDRARALCSRGVAWGEKGELDKAIADFRAVVEMADAPVEEKARALYSRGLAWGKKGEPDREMADYTVVIEMADVPAREKALALNNRGVAWSKKGDLDKAIADCTAVVEMAEAPADLKAQARANRAIAWSMNGDPDKAMADCTAVVEMADAPAEHKTMALNNRGVAWSEKGEPDKAIADFTAVVEMADAPAEQKAWALYNRGWVWGEKGEPDKAIADFTAVVEMADASPERKARALCYRGVAWSRTGDSDKAIADYTAVVEMADAPAEEKARALNNRGLAWGRKGEPDKAIADHTAVVEMAHAPVGQKARAFAGRAWAFYKAGDVAASVSDSRRALALDATLRFVRFNLGLGLLLGGQVREAVEEYRNAAALCRTSAEISQEGIVDLEAAITERGPIEGADGILQLLRAREAELRT